MRIKMLKGAAGPDGTWYAMQVVAVPDEMSRAQADQFVKRGAAVWLGGPEVETAVDRPATENADARPKRSRPRRPKE